MWDWLFETFAGVAGVTRKARSLATVAVALLGLWLCLLVIAEAGPRGLLAFGALLALTYVAAMQVVRARADLFRTARLPLAELGPPSERPGLDLPPTARSLRALAWALERARRGDCFDAAEVLEKVERDHLLPAELRLYSAARALVALGLGDADRAAVHADRALPTTSEELDFLLGRMLVSEAWSDADRLRRIDHTWAAEGVATGTRTALPRLRALVRLRIDTSAIEGIETWEARSLADEARAVGDDALAADLESRARPTAYR